jgi:tRNA threonylcarbamoyladenosine biosynthesis protein TsaE
MVHLQPIVESRSGQGAEWRGIWATEDDTLRFAQQLARSPQLAHATLTLEGDLGAGKTTLVRHLLRALGVQGRIKSPTYAVVEPHSVPGLDIWHFDFYRFSDPRELEDAGFRDIFASPGLKLVEWPRQAGAWLPQPDLEIRIGLLGEEQREVRLVAHTACGQALLGAWPLPETPAPAGTAP